MRSLWRTHRQQLAQCRVPVTRQISSAGQFEASDYVILRPTRTKSATPLFRGPLKPGKTIESHKGAISHDQIIGRRPRDIVQTTTLRGKEDAKFRLHEVRLEEYVSLCRRIVTPIYPSDANLIVSLLDLHPEPRGSDEASDAEVQKLEILEAGTGHGSLTLHLSRAIHAANGPAPKESSYESDEAYSSALETWKETRGAIIHTIDVSAKHSTHASKVVKGFRQGQYHGNVDFHAGDVSEWTSSALAQRSNEAFLSHAFLDLPSADTHLATVASALNVDGSLIVFNPNITQITTCAQKARKEGLPLELERVLELGVNGGSGGREWDVRAVRPRAWIKSQRDGGAEATVEGEEQSAGSTVEEADDSGVEMARDEEQAQVEEEKQEKKEQSVDSEGEWSMVCRPKVGERIVGGGFLGVFRKLRFD